MRLVKQALLKTASDKRFRRAYQVIGIIFVISTYFISLSPDSFLRFSYLGVLAFNAVSSGLIIMPLVVQKLNPALAVLASASGNMFNTSVNYFIGATSNTLFSGNPIVNKLKGFMKRFEWWAVLVLAITPLPLDVNGLLSGYLGIPFKKYLFVNFVGKVIIFSLIAVGVFSLSSEV